MYRTSPCATEIASARTAKFGCSCPRPKAGATVVDSVVSNLGRTSPMDSVSLHVGSWCPRPQAWYHLAAVGSRRGQYSSYRRTVSAQLRRG